MGHPSLQVAIAALDANEEEPSLGTLQICWKAFQEIPQDYYERYPRLRNTIATSLWQFEDHIRHDDPNGSRFTLATTALNLANYLIDIYIDGPDRSTWCPNDSDESVYDFLIVFESRIDPMEDQVSDDGPWWSDVSSESSS